MTLKSFNAPWGKALRWVSVLSCLLLLCVPLSVFFTVLSKTKPEAVRWLVVLPVLILPVAALFAIRSYDLEPDALVIRRLLWTTRLPLAGLQSAKAEPQAMRGSLRLCGNGGLFSFTGWYRSSALGNYRAFVTNLEKTVVLRFATKTIVVSPENPEQFVAEISQFVLRTA